MLRRQVLTSRLPRAYSQPSTAALSPPAHAKRRASDRSDVMFLIRLILTGILGVNYVITVSVRGLPPELGGRLRRSVVTDHVADGTESGAAARPGQ
jgi:hypothetical protein